jgi:hypothetical protein
VELSGVEGWLVARLQVLDVRLQIERQGRNELASLNLQSAMAI